MQQKRIVINLLCYVKDQGLEIMALAKYSIISDRCVPPTVRTLNIIKDKSNET